MKRYDAIVVGGGPAGSTTAYLLAEQGASVLLADKATFPRDKPCGGGLTVRAVRQCPVDPTPVVEEFVDEFSLRFRFGDSVVREMSEPVIWMTQRRRLDAFLLDAARGQGVEVREGVRVQHHPGNIIVIGAGERVVGDVIVGADGVNGTSARALGLGQGVEYAVAYEGNIAYEALPVPLRARCASIEIADIPGGYGWVFPKGDHANFGVGAWEREGPRLRDHLRAVCEAHGITLEALGDLRGYRLPMRVPGTRIAGERTLLVGDAAGLVDPVSGDGMYECFVSARHAATAVHDLLAGRAATLEPYEAAVDAALARLHHASSRTRQALDRWPRLTWQVLRTKLLWRSIQRLIAGDLAYPGEQRGVARLPMRALDLLGR